MLRTWEQLPENMRTDAVRPYYDILVTRKTELLGKRMLDVICSIILAVLLSPIMLLIAMVIKAEDKGPVFFGRKESPHTGESFGFLNSVQ